MKEIWEEVLNEIKEEITPHNYKTWIKPLKYKNKENDKIIIEVPNIFIKDWVIDNYKINLERIIERKISKKLIISFELNTEIKKEIHIEKEEVIEKKKENNKSKVFYNINKNYTFDSFVSGPSNQFAHAAALAVANNPATTYNPLFIYGGVGLGKTHIVHAIGNEIIKNNNNLKICYYSSEKFMNELINSLRYAKMDEFRNKFRSMDVLLIDDIQFLAGKERTQEEFFHTFNALYDSHKQIVVTSDKFPKEMPDLEERLRSRFEWGLIADIQSPDIETKQAILKMKADQNNIFLPEDVAQFLSNTVTSNVRELEGYLIRIGAYSSLTSTEVNLEMAKEVLKDILVEKNKEINIDYIQKVVSNYYHIKISDLKSSKRLKTLVLPRQISMYLSRKLTSCSFPEIGNKFGGKDHSTIIHAIKKIDEKIEKDIQLKNTVEKLMSTICK
ncbi:MAG: chromosomal replication initiator protein DnaA [Desulfuromonas sp.]|nr:MAG: chromosomal replication initiator protein DnaA [Desulfuromonas sp.]